MILTGRLSLIARIVDLKAQGNCTGSDRDWTAEDLIPFDPAISTSSILRKLKPVNLYSVDGCFVTSKKYRYEQMAKLAYPYP